MRTDPYVPCEHAKGPESNTGKSSMIYNDLTQGFTSTSKCEDGPPVSRTIQFRKVYEPLECAVVKNGYRPHVTPSKKQQINRKETNNHSNV